MSSQILLSIIHLSSLGLVAGFLFFLNKKHHEFMCEAMILMKTRDVYEAQDILSSRKKEPEEESFEEKTEMERLRDQQKNAYFSTDKDE